MRKLLFPLAGKLPFFKKFPMIRDVKPCARPPSWPRLQRVKVLDAVKRTCRRRKRRVRG